MRPPGLVAPGIGGEHAGVDVELSGEMEEQGPVAAPHPPPGHGRDGAGRPASAQSRVGWLPRGARRRAPRSTGDFTRRGIAVPPDPGAVDRSAGTDRTRSAAPGRDGRAARAYGRPFRADRRSARKAGRGWARGELEPACLAADGFPVAGLAQLARPGRATALRTSASACLGIGKGRSRRLLSNDSSAKPHG